MDLQNNDFYQEVKQILQQARHKAVAAVNTTMVQTYWLIGQKIVEQEQHGKERADYGDYLIKNLSKQLGQDFGKGFSVANLRNFRQFYLTFPELEKRYALRSELSWTHIRLIMRVPDERARDYYWQESAKLRWSSRELERNIKTNYYQRLLSSQHPENQQLTVHNVQETVLDFIKDPYVFEFLGLPQHIDGQENVLEQSLIDNLQQFLLELGKGFSFVGRQFRISTETSHFYVDLVFYNYLLKCFVVIDLKSGKLTHQDIGQMDMYVRMFDDLQRGEDDNPTIGMILCADKDETLVKYSVLSENQQLFAAKYATILPSEDELAAELQRQLRHIDLKNHP